MQVRLSVHGLSFPVACGEGILAIEELQMPGGKRLKVKEFLTGKRIDVGIQLG